MRRRSNRLRASLDYLFSISIISFSKLSRRKAISSPSMSLIGDVSVGISHRRRLLWWLLSATSPSVVLLEATELSLNGSFEIESLLVLSLGGSSPQSFPSVAQIEAFTSNRKKDQSSSSKGSSSSGVHCKISFLNLLNIQLPNNEYRTQFLSFSPTPDVGGSASRAQTGEDRKQRCKWSKAEDLVLISA
ncbi:hypothetical protein YC2023_039076 [Brassica napus]|uniref:Uncharacterized protein n=1 Tax=Brassica oleracea TaxID=3712 RepID=A0A3P6B7P5_BRAOL|nr:unnamed protein product [Brassica oleracea]